MFNILSRRISPRVSQELRQEIPERRLCIPSIPRIHHMLMFGGIGQHCHSRQYASASSKACHQRSSLYLESECGYIRPFRVLSLRFDDSSLQQYRSHCTPNMDALACLWRGPVQQVVCEVGKWDDCDSLFRDRTTLWPPCACKAIMFIMCIPRIYRRCNLVRRIPALRTQPRSQR